MIRCFKVKHVFKIVNIETLEIWPIRLYHKAMCPKAAEGMTDSIYPDQTGFDGAVCLWSWSVLFAQTCLFQNLSFLWVYVVYRLMLIYCQASRDCSWVSMTFQGKFFFLFILYRTLQAIHFVYLRNKFQYSDSHWSIQAVGHIHREAWRTEKKKNWDSWKTAVIFQNIEQTGFII